MPTQVIRFENISKLYQLGTVGTGTLSHDLRRWWITRVLRREDPYLKIGETNDRAVRGHSDYVYALRDINIDIEEGDVVGIVGKNGAGKSTLLKLLSRVTAPSTGRIVVHGRVASLLEVGTGFHPELTGRENIYMNGCIMGMKRSEIDRKLDEIIDFSGCERYIDTPVKRYSSGMTVRLGFAVAAHLEPEILVVDEVLAVGDAEFQKKAIGKMHDISHHQGRTVLFVSHNMSSIQNLCTKGILLKNGKIDFNGDIGDTIQRYLANQQDRSRVDIGDIVDRSGNGALRFTGIQFTDINAIGKNTFKVGETMIITVSFQTTERFRNARNSRIDISIRDMYDKPVSWLSSYINKQKIDSDSTHLVFRIPRIMLNAGSYNMNLYSSVDGDIADWVRNVSSFNIVFGNYFGNGSTIPEGQGPCVTDFICEHGTQAACLRINEKL